MAKPPIFLLGVPRSGTTLLRTILDSHGHLACGPEAPWLARHHPLSVMALYERLLHDKDAYCQSFAMPAESARAATRSFIDDLFTRFARARGKVRWAHKTPDDILYLDFFLTLFPEAKFIHLVRHPLDVALSTAVVSENRRGISDWHAQNLLLQEGVILENNLFSAVLRWKSWNDKIERHRSRMDYHRLHFEELLKEPRRVLGALFEFLDEPFDARCLDYARFEHLLPAWEWGSADVRQWKTLEPGRADRWQKELSPVEQAVLSSVALAPTQTTLRPACAALGSAEELATEPFRLFMGYINSFAARLDLRVFTDWSKVWEYPWLWFHSLGIGNWTGQRLVDLGSEISPMPWLLATLGARVTLIETDPQWVPRWEALRARLGVDVDWHLVDSERLPLADAEADVLTSFSVVEHQPDKRRALDEVARVLKPGGTLAISFDICEPDLGMTFPAWNGHALTLREFEEVIWRHPAFDPGVAPDWNRADMAAFRTWNLRSAPHHNYVVAAAALTRRADGPGAASPEQASPAAARRAAGEKVSPLSARSVRCVPDLRMSSTPQRILFLRPDAYGDLCLFEPVLRLVRDAWPQAEVAVLIRRACRDIAPLLDTAGVRWLTVDCNPYREGPGDCPAALEELRDTLRAFAPDCVVAACAEQTWLESAAAAFLPGIRQVSFGPGLTDPTARAALSSVLPVDWEAIYPEKIPVGPETRAWEQNLRLAGALLGREAPRWWPVVEVPASARAQAQEIVAAAGLTPGEFAACAAAGTANVSIKHWPAEAYGETLAWLEKERGVRALLLGHVSERGHLEAVQRAARQGGGEPALWLGQDGEMPVAAALLDAARLYFGNDTGALHLAAALGRPVVAVFGGGTWPRFQPVAARARTVVQPLPCFGCAWDCYYVDAPCVRTISPAAVRRALQEILDGGEGSVVVEVEGLDAGARALIDRATPHLRFLRTDSADRLRQVVELSRQSGETSARLQSSDTDRDARRKQVEELTALLRASETDRDARQEQVRELTALLKTSEADCDARQEQVGELTGLLKTSETDRDARRSQVEELTTLLHASEADRDARQSQVEELSAWLKISEADRQARQEQVGELTGLLKTSEADRQARQEQVEELTGLLKTSDADRDARQSQVEELTALLKTSEADRDARQEQIGELSALLRTSEADRDARQEQIEQLTGLLKTSDADRDARQNQIEELTALLQTSEADRYARFLQIEQLTAMVKAGEAERDACVARIETLTARLQTQAADQASPSVATATGLEHALTDHS